jgi:hypothetical protein
VHPYTIRAVRKRLSWSWLTDTLEASHAL